jgi:hypothetical protein
MGLTWQRIASELFQPLGLKVFTGHIYIACRDQIVCLRDTNWLEHAPAQSVDQLHWTPRPEKCLRPHPLRSQDLVIETNS